MTTETAAPVKRKRRTKADKDYISNKEMLEEVLKCQRIGITTPRMGELFMILTQRYATKPNFSGYSYKDEMISHALVACCASVDKFNSEKSENPFAYYTQVIHSAFLQILNKEKKHQRIRDKSLMEANMMPSFSYLESEANTSQSEYDVDNAGIEMLESEPSEKIEGDDEPKKENTNI